MLRISSLLVLTAISAQAQPITPQLALARICASEEGIERLTDGCAAIHTVLVRGAARRHMSYVAYAHAYSSGVFDGDGRRPWLADLQADGRQPARWPLLITRRVRGHVVVRRHAPWSLYRDAWLALYAHAGLIIRGEIVPLCDALPDHWGSPTIAIDRERATRFIAAGNWEAVTCGDTNNAFFRILTSEERNRISVRASHEESRTSQDNPACWIASSRQTCVAD